jgi:NAD(P)H dehydrogenase (quinone)
MHAPPKADYPVVTVDDLTNYDGFIFGFPTRYGTDSFLGSLLAPP